MKITAPTAQKCTYRKSIFPDHYVTSPFNYLTSRVFGVSSLPDLMRISTESPPDLIRLKCNICHRTADSGQYKPLRESVLRKTHIGKFFFILIPPIADIAGALP